MAGILLEEDCTPLPRLDEPFTFDKIIHSSLVIRNLIALAKKVAPTEAIILITGESGTGKELFARAIHAESRRAEGPFVAINCAAMPDSLLEAELFGYEKGAFTGAVGTRKGKFEQADHGTLFLDEIGDMSLQAQAKILRSIQDHAVQRVGANQLIQVDIRILCATNRKLHEEVGRGTFRQDLFFRLNEVNIEIPALRERDDDLAPLIQHFISIYNSKYGKEVTKISPAAFEVLKRHPWPGNIRELEHLIHHSVLMAEGDTVWVEHLPSAALTQSFLIRSKEEGEGDETHGPLLSLDDMEARHIRRVLNHVGWNKTRAATILKVSRPTLDRKIEKYMLARE